MSSKSKSKAKSKSKSKSKKGTNERESRRRQSDHGEKGPRSRSIPKKSSTPIPAKSDATKLKRSPSYRSSLTQRPQRYSFHATQRTSSGRNLQQSYAAADEMDDIPVISMGILSTPEPEDSPEPPTKPGHKKNAVSSFLSIFSNFSQSRQRKANPYLNSIDAMSDLEVLKRMKRRILDLLSRPTIGIENKKLKKIKAELKSEVWDNEYTELKKRLSIHDIHKASAKQKFNQFTSLKQLSSLHSNDDDEDGVQEMATFLLQEYFDQPSIGPSTSMNTMANSKSQHHQQRIDEEQEEENGDDFGISPRPLSVYTSIRESQANSIDDVKYAADDDDDEDDESLHSSDHSFYEDDEDGNEEEKQAQMNSNSHTKHKDKSKRSSDKQPSSDTTAGSSSSATSSKHASPQKNAKKKSSKNLKFKHRKSDRLAINAKAGDASDTSLHSLSRERQSSKTQPLAYSPRAVSPQPIGSFEIAVADQEKNANAASKKQSKPKRKSKQHRLAIRAKFRRGVRKAMLVNAWTEMTNKKDCDLTIAVNDDEALKVKNLASPSSTSSVSNILMNFLSDNLKLQLSKVGTWEFDPFEFFDTPEIGGRGLVYAVWYLFDTYDLFKLFPVISPKKFMKFLTLVEEGYLDNPYHNKIHAADVVSNVAYYLNHTQFFEKHTSAFDKFTAILSAAVHDLGHDGQTNAFHISAMSDIALTYNDISVLENYHIATTFKILKRADCNWYKQLTKPVQRYLRQAMIDIVLATDMKFHNQKVATLTELIACLKHQLNSQLLVREQRDSIVSSQSMGIPDPFTPGTPSMLIGGSGSQSSLINLSGLDLQHKTTGSDPLEMDYQIQAKTLADFPLYKYKVNELGVEHLLHTVVPDVVHNGDELPRVNDQKDERRFILCFVVHLCDISNCAKSLKSGKKWATRVMTEFFKQGDRERALGMDVTAMMDRRRSSTPQGQLGFIKFVLRPSYEKFVRLVPEASKPLELLNENLEYWQIQQTLATQARKKRAKSVGAINQTPVLMMMQDQLKNLQLNREPSPEDKNENESASDNEDDDTRSMRSVKIYEDDEEEDTPQPQENGQTQTPTPQQQRKSDKNKHVGFKDQLIIQKMPDSNGHGRDPSNVHDYSVSNASSIVISINDEDSKSEITDAIAMGTSSNGSLSIRPHHGSSKSHQGNGSSLSYQSSSGRTRQTNTNLSMDLDNLDLPNSPLISKVRAHSIHVSIPTSEKQLQSQPQPFSELIAELRKEYEAKEEEEQQHKDQIRRRRQRTQNAMSASSDALARIKQTEPPKVSQSVSASVADEPSSELLARISMNSMRINVEELGNKKSNKKQDLV